MGTDEENLKRVWYIVLGGTKAKHWLLDRLDYSHIYAMRKSPAGTMWTVINPTTACIEATTIPVQVMPNPIDYCPLAERVFRIVVDPDKLIPFRIGFGVLSCTTVIKGLLGVHKLFLFTPRQLLTYLLNDSDYDIREIHTETDNGATT